MNKKALLLILLINFCSYLSFSQNLKTLATTYYTNINFDYLSINPAHLGAMYSFIDRMQVGLSMPNVFSHAYWSNDINGEKQQVKEGYLTVHAIIIKRLSFRGIGGLRVENTKLFNQNNISYIQTPTLVITDLGLELYHSIIFGATVHNVNSEINRSIDVYANYFFRNGIRIGGAYQISKNINQELPLLKVNIGYAIYYKSSTILNARYL